MATIFLLSSSPAGSSCTCRQKMAIQFLLPWSYINVPLHVLQIKLASEHTNCCHSSTSLFELYCQLSTFVPTAKMTVATLSFGWTSRSRRRGRWPSALRRRPRSSCRSPACRTLTLEHKKLLQQEQASACMLSKWDAKQLRHPLHLHCLQILLSLSKSTPKQTMSSYFVIVQQ